MEEALSELDLFLSQSLMTNVGLITVIHGKGTGALRAALWKYFKSDRRIKSYRHGEYGEGDAGVTVLTLG